MSDDLLLALAYAVIFIVLVVLGVAMWMAGKEK